MSKTELRTCPVCGGTGKVPGAAVGDRAGAEWAGGVGDVAVGGADGESIEHLLGGEGAWFAGWGVESFDRR